MFNRVLLLSSLIAGFLGCSGREDYFLDRSIPRLQSPAGEIAYLRTKWRNGKHIETAYYDHQNRVLEVFKYGSSSSKLFITYEGSHPKTTILYEHGDSSEPGFLTIDTLRQEYDADGRLVLENHLYGVLSESRPDSSTGFSKRYLGYTASGDTIVKKRESSYKHDSSRLTDTIHWERDNKQRLTRYYRLYVIRQNSGRRADTLSHFSQRYAYDARGRLKMAWFDYMYLGQFYMVAGPDTILYRYNFKNQLIEEERRYTTNMGNKHTMDTSALTLPEKGSTEWYKQHFFVGTDMMPSNNRTDLIKYRYEKFDAAKHQLLNIPTSD
jgi:hypothetical protein